LPISPRRCARRLPASSIKCAPHRLGVAAGAGIAQVLERIQHLLSPCCTTPAPRSTGATSASSTGSPGAASSRSSPTMTRSRRRPRAPARRTLARALPLQARRRPRRDLVPLRARRLAQGAPAQPLPPDSAAAAPPRRRRLARAAGGEGVAGQSLTKAAMSWCDHSCTENSVAGSRSDAGNSANSRKGGRGPPDAAPVFGPGPGPRSGHPARPSAAALANACAGAPERRGPRHTAGQSARGGNPPVCR